MMNGRGKSNTAHYALHNRLISLLTLPRPAPLSFQIPKPMPANAPNPQIIAKWYIPIVFLSHRCPPVRPIIIHHNLAWQKLFSQSPPKRRQTRTWVFPVPEHRKKHQTRRTPT